MHHLYPSLKGDQLCPLGFHPQTRYPTRCKRCFRDYKEHGARRGDDVAASSPNLTDGQSSRPSSRTWTSTQNLTMANGGGSSNDIVVHFNVELKKRPLSWASTPDIDETDAQKRNTASSARAAEEHNVDVTVKLPVQSRRHTTTLDLNEMETSVKQNRVTASPSKSSNIPDELIILSTDSLAERVRKMNLLKKQRSLNSRESSRERSVPPKKDSDSETESKPPPDRPERSKSGSALSDLKRSLLPPKKTATVSSSSSTSATLSSSTRPVTVPMATISETKTSSSSSSLTTQKIKTSSTTSSTSLTSRKDSDRQKAAEDVQFMLKIKDTKRQNQNDNHSLTTETTDTTLVGINDRELQDEIKGLRTELGAMKTRAERAEREKSDILLRRLASLDTTPNRTAASEALNLQQKVNELKEQLDKVSEDKRKLNSRMKELENRGNESELKRKLQAAEQICEELMDENQSAKKEILNLQAEMDELQDTFRDDEVKAKTNIQKDLEKSTKNCRILSFKLKKCERRIDSLEQEKQSSFSDELSAKVKRLEEELRFSNDLSRKLQAEAEELRNPGKKKAPMLGVLGKSTSADAKVTRESLTRGGSQEDPQHLQRELQDSIERETDLKDQLKFAEEEAENLRKKVARFEDENDSLMMQLKKMATRSRTRKLSPTPNRLAPEVQADRDEGISDEDDPAELRILLELNEQESSLLRHKVEELEKENSESKKHVRELQNKIRQDASSSSSKSSLLLGSNSNASDKKLKALTDELTQLRKSVLEKDRTVERLQAELAKSGSKSALPDVNVDTRRQLSMVEQEASVLRTKITTLESDNEKLLKENKKMQLQALRKSSSSGSEKNFNGNGELSKLKEFLSTVERERNELTAKLKRMQVEADGKLPTRNPKQVTDLTPKNHLKKWVEELEDEIHEMRVLVTNSSADKLKDLQTEKSTLEDELKKSKQKLLLAEGDVQRLKLLTNSTPKLTEMEQKLKKSDDETRKMNLKVKDLEDKIKKQDNQIKQSDTIKATLETQTKRDKDKISTLEKDYEKEHKEREKLESKITQLDKDLGDAKKSAEKTKSNLEKDIKDLKTKSSKSDSKQLQELKKQLEDVQTALNDEKRRYDDLNTHWEKLSEETILMRAQLTTEKKNLQTELSGLKQKLGDMDSIRIERTELAKKLNEAQEKIRDLEAKTLKTGSSSEHEKSMLKNKLSEKEHEYKRLQRENEMNIHLVFQLRKDNDDLSSKLSDFNRIEQAQSSINGHSARMESEIKDLKQKLQSSEFQLKSEVAATRLRYEPQVKTLSSELTSMQRQCERFKKDRDACKHMLEAAQKKIIDLKANTGRQSRGSMHSSDDDDKSKIAYLDQQIGCLEDQLVEARLEVSKVKTELVSERSANEIKISEMRSKLNEFEEERVIGSGRTKIPGMKTKLELSWQKEREDQQRLLQETSTLARDLRQTLFEVERERDKERLESKRKVEQTKRSTEEEMEEGRKKIAELQCDLLELRDVHAKLRTSNEKLRRERERSEKELIKRRMEHDGGERKVGALLQTVDELVKIAPDLKKITTGATASRSGNTLRPEQASPRRSRSPSPTLSNTQITSVLARLAEASEELRKFQRLSEDENERARIRRSNLRRAASQENDPHGSTNSVASTAGSQRNGSRLSRTSASNGSLIRKSLSLDHSIQKDQNIWRQDDGSVSSMQSIDSELGGLVRDSSLDSRLDSRLSGGSTQSDIPRGPRKKKKSLMGKLRSLTKSSRNSESEISVQGSDSDISVASDMRSSKKDLRNRLSGMFKRSGSTSRSGSTEHVATEARPVAVTVVGDPDGPQPREPPPANAMTPKPIRSIAKPPTATPTTPITKRRLAK